MMISLWRSPRRGSFVSWLIEEGSASMRGFVCYCPELDIYRYREEQDAGREGREANFTGLDLYEAVKACLEQGKDDDAELLAKVTAVARGEPHMYVIFEGGGEEPLKMRVESPEEHRAAEKTAAGGAAPSSEEKVG